MKKKKGFTEGFFLHFLEREREPLLSRFAGNSIAGIRRDKKESRSTQ